MAEVSNHFPRPEKKTRLSILPTPAKNGFELQDGDAQLLNLVFQLRFETIDHLATRPLRFVRSGKAHKAQGVCRLTSPVGQFKKHIYTVGFAGVLILIEHRYASRETSDKRSGSVVR